MSGVSHIRGNPPGTGHYTGRTTWWLTLLMSRCRLCGSILIIIRSKVDLDTDTPAPRGQVCIPAGQLGTACPTCMWALRLNTDLISLTDRSGWSMISSLKLLHQYTHGTILNGTESNPYPVITVVKPDYEIKYVIGWTFIVHNKVIIGYHSVLPSRPALRGRGSCHNTLETLSWCSSGQRLTSILIPPALRGQVCIPAGRLCTAFCVNCPTCVWALQLNTDLVYLIMTLAQNHILTAAQWYHKLRFIWLYNLWDSSFFRNRMQGLLQ